MARRFTSAPSPEGSLRIALLAYKGNPFCGGQGVYVRHLSRELARLGHQVEVLAGQPYPVVDVVQGVQLTEISSLDLYRQPDPFRTPKRSEFRDFVDVLEVGTMWTAGFPEPLTFSLRALRHLSDRRGEFDVVHDNQCLGYGLLGMPRLGFPTLATIHHPIQVDRALELAAATTGKRRASVRRWYAFTRMQTRVAQRLQEIITVSGSSAEEIEQYLGVPRQRITTIPIGADTDLFSPDTSVAKVPGRIVATASADSPLKGLLPLVEALAKVRVEHGRAELVVVGRTKPGGVVDKAVERLGLTGAIRFVHGVSDQELVDLIRSAEVACVPSLYEGFSLPAVEAMSCGAALVSTTGGAIPEVAGRDGETTLAVEPNDPSALSAAICRLLDDSELRERLGRAARLRVLEKFTWRAAAAATADRYRAVIEASLDPIRWDDHRNGGAPRAYYAKVGC
jgi:glycosyltransferase involved in cell wall biosynthesis